MGRIRVLDDRLIDRIAAGEVVERPASVAKELIENSLDAGAGNVEVALLSGGRRSIRIVDDGCGMDRDDALLALERHATSKLGSARDLDSIATLGFRGEALSSIAAVSQFTLSTSMAAGEGTEVRVRGGRIESVREAALPRGTVMEVARLFFNTPARRKFLRTENTELAHVTRWLTRYALAHPEVRFLLSNNERELIRVAPAADLAQRVSALFGTGFAERLMPFESVSAGLRISGLAGRPVDALSRRDQQHFFVNGRAVQDRVLAHALSDAYGNTMPRGRCPVAFVFLEMDPDGVDVNVHPQKTEVRFRDRASVHDAVRDAVAGGLSHAAVVPSYSDLRPGAWSDRQERVADAAADYLERTPAAGDVSTWTEGTSGPPVSEHEAPASRSGGDLLGTGWGLASDPDVASADVEPEPEYRAVALAQYDASYILAKDPEGLVIVDQHAAHERVIFERLLAEAERNEVEVQRLMFPATVELTPAERVLVEEEMAEFHRLGVSVEPFGGNTVRVDGVPAVAAEIEPERLLRELLGEASAARAATSDVGALRHRLVTSAACQAAIKIHHPLTRDAMQALLDDLFRLESPSTCPHGRPVLFRLTLEEIERTFRRR